MISGERVDSNNSGVKLSRGYVWRCREEGKSGGKPGVWARRKGRIRKQHQIEMLGEGMTRRIFVRGRYVRVGGQW
jgi:hypothetical protein